ncbi:zinc finger protein CONSTANS-LIKE 14-like [Salvia miltiorrhiza]|uniref:zinc finger protein CONSTANS-LIKE 14-like n=1 Tax=Salvia miltiorrhiza TaxID=226208 RepID=UPI0025ABA7C0|nr:zinc finger protein CONSTANS-LIKE 14-like [Salvia miltiorrhiza]XP_057771257.1 zinc finger protein CONSTANS-LIKE 14-like [Salvia miltiorrhiza]
MVSCDFCGERQAILYCRADSAKLCLSCDQHVHCANALSKKHLRSQICDNCAAEPASFRCSTDGLVLCQDCDWDAHGSRLVAAAHDRCPIDSFSGCPSAFELAAAWGLEIEEKKPASCEWGGLLEELMVPNASSMIYSDCGGELVKKKKNPSCGKQKQVILKQLIELIADGGGGDGEDVGPGTPSGGAWRQESFCGQYEEQPQEQQQELPQGGGFTSLLMLQTPANQKEERNMLWNTTACDHSAQIWDFNLGQLRGHEESSPVELEFGGSDVYTMKRYGELLKEASLAKRRGVDVSGVNCSITQEDIIPFNSATNNQTPSQGPATSESNNAPVARPSSCSGLTKPESLGGSKDMQFTSQSILMTSESVAAMSKSDMELLAKNRGNAMQRYKEKKKTRRYDKHIRYESRKARADTRKRVKGRFVKAHEAPAG